MKRADYLRSLIALFTVDEMKKSAANPSAYMTPTHIKLHYIALRKLGY